jgi:tRNA A-37 threonylcarbamoyl transferase component Bud32
MTERDIFLNALERDDPAARAAYLDAACAGQPALRRRVEELLRRHREDTAFLNVPVMEQLAAAEESIAFLGQPAEPGSLGRLDRYEVLELVGRGGTGVVLKARDTKLQRVVAVKLLARQLAASDTARQRFVREAQAAAAVRDDHVVAIYEVHDGGPYPYLVMEYIAGVTLEDVIRRGTPPDLREILRIGSQVARGLAAAHAQGLVHSDIKPANILLENGVQRVRITDFGLARAAARPAERGVIAGTPLYMSPEQARGEPTDHRSDLFSFGSVLYALCTGRPPFQGDTAVEVLRRVCEDRPRPIRESHPGVPEWLCGLIGKLHAKEPGDRYATAREVADLLGHQLALAQQPSPAGSRRRRWWWFGAGLAVVLLAAVAVAEFAARAKSWNRPESGDPPGEAAPSRYAGPVASLALRREDIPPALLTLAGGGDPAQAPPELAAVLGDKEFLLPRVGAVQWMQQSPDEKTLAVPLDGDVVIFEVPTGKYLRTLTGPGGRVVCVSFSRDSRLPGHSGVVHGLTFSPDGTRLAAGGEDRTVHLHGLANGDSRKFTMPAAVTDVTFSSDGRTLAAVGDAPDGAVRLWDLDTGQETTLEGHTGPVRGMAIAPAAPLLASCAEDGTVRLWERTAGESRARTIDLGRFPSGVRAVAFTPDGRYLVTANGNGTVYALRVG